MLATACANRKELVILAEAWEPVHGPRTRWPTRCRGRAAALGRWSWSPGFEISTDTCNWATVGQPITTVLRPGDVLDVGATHLDLWAPGEAEAVIAIGIEEVELVRWVRPIPAPPPSCMTRSCWRIASLQERPSGSTCAPGTNSYRPARIASQ